MIDADFPDYREVEAFYRQGRQSLDEHGERMPYGGAGTTAAATPLSVQTLRNARAFARLVGKNPELRKLVGDAKAHGTLFGTSFAQALLSAPREAWRELIKEAGENGWSTRELARQIRIRYAKDGNRRRCRVGRLPTAIRTEQGLMLALIQLCQRGILLLDDRQAGGKDRARIPRDLAADAKRLRRTLTKFVEELQARSTQ